METFKSNKDKSGDEPVFDTRTLRLIIGALAFAFPSTVIVLTGKITTSISASYYEEGNRDVFVGFLFILGALLIAYKGRLQGRPKRKSKKTLDWILSFKWIRVYQEQILSTLGGVAAIFTALYPTACDGCPINSRAVIHMSGAFILFSTVVYFCLVAFPRRVNKKLVRENPRFRSIAYTIKRTQSLNQVHSARELRNLWFPTLSTFFSIASQISTDYDRNDTSEIARALLDKSDDIDDKVQFAQVFSDVEARKPWKLKFMWLAYGKKITRGIVYLVCGSLITITLALFLRLVLIMPDEVAHSTITFKVETISLVFFGIAWMTASQLEYLKQIQSWLKPKPVETSEALQSGTSVALSE